MTYLEKVEKWLKSLDNRIRNTDLFGIGDFRDFAKYLDNQQESEGKEHEHYFEFSHFETEDNPGVTVKIGNIRILICRTCGLIIKSLI